MSEHDVHNLLREIADAGCLDINEDDIRADHHRIKPFRPIIERIVAERDAARAELAAAVQDSEKATPPEWLVREDSELCINHADPAIEALYKVLMLDGDCEYALDVLVRWQDALNEATPSAEATGQTETDPPADTCVCGCPKRAHQVEVAPATMPGWYSPPIHDCINHDGCRYQLAAPAAAEPGTIPDDCVCVMTYPGTNAVYDTTGCPVHAAGGTAAEPGTQDGAPVDIHDAIEAWHNGDGYGTELHEYLGWLWADYARWAETGVLPAGSRYSDRKAAAGGGQDEDEEAKA